MTAESEFTHALLYTEICQAFPQKHVFLKVYHF
jgi:hypothetical protein